MATYGERMFDPTVHEEYNLQLQLEAEDDHADGGARKEDLSNMTLEERRKHRENQFFVPQRNNLKFKTMAQYKAIQDGNTQLYEDID